MKDDNGYVLWVLSYVFEIGWVRFDYNGVEEVRCVTEFGCESD